MARGNRSSAKFVSYDLRPAKQTERRIILDTLQIATDSGLSTPKYRYVGMGGNRFYDFLLMHKYLGTSNMISLEHDKNMYDQACFNQPYKFIEVKNINTQEFIDNDDYDGNSIYWFDYDGALSDEITADINSMGTKLNLGDFFFITIFAGVPNYLDKMSSSERLSWFKDKFGNLASEVTREDVTNVNYFKANYKIVMAAIKNAFAYSDEANFISYLKIKYQDTKPMITIGGVLTTSNVQEKLLNNFREKMPFLNASSGKLFDLKVPNVTEKERLLFDLATTNKRTNSKEMNHLLKLGFKPKDMSNYSSMLRYLPRYVETIF